MNAVALLHPDVSAKAVIPFQKFCPDLRIVPDLSSEREIDAALIFGGDGTVHRYLPELHEYKIPTLVVPVGSGNDFARTLGIGSVSMALNAWKEYCLNAEKNVREIDLGVIRSGGKQTLFCCVAGAGLDADSNGRANRMPTWLRGHGGYVLAALWSLAVGRPKNVRISSPEIDNKGMIWFVALGNGHRYGGGLKITPRASLEDGLLDVCAVGKMNKVKLLCALPSVFWGAHLKLKQVHYLRTARVRLEADQGLHVYADGEPICRTPADFSVRPKALKVIVPG